MIIINICITLVLVVSVLTLIGILIMGIFWSRTQHGKLDYKAAIILKLRNFFIREEKFIPKIMRQEENARVNSLGRRSNKKIEIRDLIVTVPKREIPIRLYHPGNKKTLPVFIYYHGGGWVTGNIESSDDRCREYVQQIDAITIAVHYRLSNAVFTDFRLPANQLKVNQQKPLIRESPAPFQTRNNNAPMY